MHKYVGTLVGIVALVSVAAGSQAQHTPQIEAEAMAALTQMGSYLRSLKAFQVEAVTSREEVLKDGQKVQFTGTTSALARMPDRLRVSTTSDRADRLWVYNGNTLSLLARRSNYYVIVPAPPTIAQLADVLDDKYGLELPLEDLFRFGGPHSRSAAAITSAMFIGPSEVDGVTCGHYAFRQQGLDWQVWIQRGDYPLPRKLVLTTLTDEARPQFVATYTWNLAPSYNEAAFTFEPPTGAGKVVLADAK